MLLPECLLCGTQFVTQCTDSNMTSYQAEVVFSLRHQPNLSSTSIFADQNLIVILPLRPGGLSAAAVSFNSVKDTSYHQMRALLMWSS